MAYILGISSFYHDSAAALIKDNTILAAVQEERFTRIKNDHSFPLRSIVWILNQHKITMEDIDSVVFYEKPFIKFERILETCIRFAPKGYPLFNQALPGWLKEKLFQKVDIKRKLSELAGGHKWNKKLLFSDHHLSHCAAAFYSSPFDSAAILSIDGVGEWSTTTIAKGNGTQIERLSEIKFPHSLGMLYSTITAFLGFKVNSGEYKVMGLAPYGKPRFAETIKDHLVDIKSDGSFRLNMKYFRFATELRMFGPELERLFGMQQRRPEGELNQEHMDLAASLQAVTNELFVLMAQHVRDLTGEANLCLAGGVALNCAGTGKILDSAIFDKIWIQPAAGDAGSALGAAQICLFQLFKRGRMPDNNYQPFWGPFYTQEESLRQLDEMNAQYEILPDRELYQEIAESLAGGKVIAWFQGRAEFTPRALGNRSILADPRVPTLKRDLNLKIKYRESFRPFAPAILAEDAMDWFFINQESPYMNFTFKARTGVSEKIPSVIHVDGTARLQTVSADTNKRFYNLIKEFKNITGCPVLVNTSFNIRGEPMVLSPEDAFNCFMNTEIDILVIGNIKIEKVKQNRPIFTKYNYNLD